MKHISTPVYTKYYIFGHQYNNAFNNSSRAWFVPLPLCDHFGFCPSGLDLGPLSLFLLLLGVLFTSVATVLSIDDFNKA
jgi:hypothetical protein